MRDRARQRALATAKSRRATPEELREAGKRVKEIEQELLQIDLLPETKVGEERAARYSRLLRLRSMREDFQSDRPLENRSPSKSLLLALVMTVASFLLCAFCAGGSYTALQIVNQKPDPTVAASNFWDDMIHQRYVDIQSNYLAPGLRFQYDQTRFVSQANAADQAYGQVVSAVVVKQTLGSDQATITYSVTRANRTNPYTMTLGLGLHGGAWGVSDLGAALDPSLAGVPTPTPAAQPSPTTTPTDTSTDSNSTGDIVVPSRSA